MEKNRLTMVRYERAFLCRRIAVLRKDAKLSQKDLASLVGISPANLSRIESGKVNVTLDTYLHILYVMCYTLETVSDLPF